jgi:hypothetical protein
LGGQFAPESGGQFAPELGGQFTSELGGQFDRFFQLRFDVNAGRFENSLSIFNNPHPKRRFSTGFFLAFA